MHRIVFVLPSFAGGGAERVTLALAGALDRARFEVEIVVLDGNGPLAPPPGIRVHDLARPRLRQALGPLRTTLRARTPDSILSTMGYLNLAVLGMAPILAGHPRVLVREANLPAKSIEAMRWPALARLAYRTLYPRADAVLCNARVVADALRTEARVRPTRLHILDNPIDVATIRASLAPMREPGDGVRFVAAGRLTYQKGFDRLIDLMAEFGADAHLTILGDGPDRAALAARIAERGAAARVRLAGFVPSPWAYYAGADAFLLSSRWEGMPNAALAAMACGTPVIAVPEAGGIGEITAEGDAVTLAPWGPAFRTAMMRVVAQPMTGPRPSRLPARFALDTVARRLEPLLLG